MTSPSRASRVPTTMGILAVVLLAGCGERPNPSAAGSPALSPTGIDVATVTFGQAGGGDAAGAGGGEGYRSEIEVVAAAGRGVRVTVKLFGDPRDKAPQEVFTRIWDGTRLLAYDSMGDPRFVVYEAPAEHPGAWMGMGLWARELMGPVTGTKCRALGRHRTVHRRDAVGYRCTTAPTQEQGAHTEDYWFDQASGILLAGAGFEPKQFSVARSVDPKIFDTAPPAGAQVVRAGDPVMTPTVP